MNAENSEDEYDDYDTEDEGVELGFVRTITDIQSTNALLHTSMKWSDWDGGKIGGQPSWLNPLTIPLKEDLYCKECHIPLTFLLQIYCPLDDIETAFHRTLYIFCCRYYNCKEQGNGRVFRCQLPKKNLFYPEKSEDCKAFSRTQEIQSILPSLCVLCGQRALFTCSACKIAQYCSKLHQKDHWKHGHKLLCCAKDKEEFTSLEIEWQDKLRTNGSACVFPEYELEIDQEPDGKQAVNDHEAQLLEQFHKQKMERDNNTELNDSENPFTNDSAIDVTQNELRDILGSKSKEDPMYIRFLTRNALAKKQVLRYSRWNNNNVLWVQSNNMTKEEDVPPCEKCGSKRAFEFQVLPQLLGSLKVDNQVHSLSDISKRTCEWGTLAVYTCTSSCDINEQYTQEYLHYQEPYHGT